MSFTDGKPRIATEQDCKARWSCGKPGERFRCCLCGHKFVVGDVWRFQFTNNIPNAGGNPLVCEKCDGPDVVERWKKMCEEYKTKFWHFHQELK
jgi:hypothetical protein